MHDLGTLGGQFSTGYAINDAGQVVGEANIAGPRLLGHAFLYTNCQMNDLGTLGGTYSVGYDIDNTGQVVGTSTLSNGRADAFVYSDGQLYDVNDLIDPTQGITLSSTTAINDKGQKLANDFLTRTC